MRLGVIADNVAESLALGAGVVPEPVVLGAWGLWASRLLLVAAKLGVFDALVDGPGTAAELAPRLAVSEEGLERLLRALNGLGYLHRRRGAYRLSKVAQRWLTSSAKSSMRDALLFIEELWNWSTHLEEAVRTGRGVRLHDEGVMSEASWGRYMRGLATFAQPAGKEVVRRLSLGRPPRRLLDVGGGHGLYAAAFCHKYPELSAEVLDLPSATAHGRQIVRDAGMATQVTFRDGDLRTADWGAGYDVVLLFNVLHNSTADEARQALSKAQQALAPGGVVAIQEAEYRAGDGNLSFTAGFGELFFFMVSGARTWPEQTLRGWLTEAGFEGVTTQRLWMAPAVVVSGRRP